MANLDELEDELDEEEDDFDPEVHLCEGQSTLHVAGNAPFRMTLHLLQAAARAEQWDAPRSLDFLCMYMRHTLAVTCGKLWNI